MYFLLKNIYIPYDITEEDAKKLIFFIKDTKYL